MLNFPFQNTLLFLCIALALLVVSSMLIHYINPPHFLDVALSAESLYFLYIAGVRLIFLPHEMKTLERERFINLS